MTAGRDIRSILIRVTLVLSVVAPLVSAGAALAAPGTLARSFAGDGRQWLCLHEGCGLEFRDAMAGPDGTVIAAGWTFAPALGDPGFTHDFVLARYEHGGLPDPSFGHRGLVESESFGSASLQYGDAVVDRQGRILVSGAVFQKPFHGLVVRYQPDGSVDHSFGDDGVARTLQSGDALAIAGDGSILVGGGDHPRAHGFQVVTKLDSSGDPDPSFSGDGIAKWVRCCGLHVDAMAVDGKGRILGAGSIHSGDKERKTLAVARLTSSGRVDRSFGHGGLADAHFSRHSEARALATLPDGRILAVGTRGATSLPKASLFALARFRPNGRLDRSFSGDGIRTTDFGFPDFQYASSVALQPDGRAIVAGAGGEEFRSGKFVAARYLRNGRLDASFGRRGKTETAFPSARGYHSMCAAASSATLLSGNRFALAGVQYGCTEEEEEGYTGPGHLGVLTVYKR